MYQPAAFRVDETEALHLIHRFPLAQLIVVGDGLPMATPVPMIVRGGSLVGHLARANHVWRHAGHALAIFTAAQAYVSPRWYEGKQIDGKVVPTWNYSTVQVRGRLVAHDDASWTRQLVSDLTDHFEADHAQPWSVDDAPPAFIDAQVRGIVGIELVELEIVGKQKLSQNRSQTDRRQVVTGLAAGSEQEQAVAEAMSESLRE